MRETGGTESVSLVKNPKTSFQVTMKTAWSSLKQNIPACLSSSFWGREAGSLQLTCQREGRQYLGETEDSSSSFPIPLRGWSTEPAPKRQKDFHQCPAPHRHIISSPHQGSPPLPFDGLLCILLWFLSGSCN